MTKSPFRIAALVLMAVLLATNFYRAATQSIVHDEALSWELYISGPISAIFQTYTANNHFLATLLFRISTTFFGDSEFAMRLPSVLAGAWFFWTVFQLCALLFSDGWFFLLGFAVLTLNPILLDFLVAARGYGLAMAGLFWALFQMLAWFDDRQRGIGADVLRKRLWKAAIGSAVAVAANFTLLMPVSLLALAFCVLLLKKPEPASSPEIPPPPKPRKKSKKSRPEAAPAPTRSYASFLHFVVPVAVLALAFVLAAPIDMARTEDLYAGSPTALKSLQSLAKVSFAYADRSGLQQIEHILSSVAIIFLPVIAVAALVLVSTSRAVLASAVGLATFLSSLAVVGSALLLAAAHLATGIPYPEDRTGIYFVPLTSLAALGLARILADLPGFPRWIGFATAAVLLSFALEFAAQWNVHSFWVWRYDADTKRVFDALEAAAKPAAQTGDPIRLGVSWVFEPALNYYRERHNAAWLAPVQRDGFDGARQFYVVSSDDQKNATLPKRKQIYRSPLVGTEVAVPQ